MRVSCSAAFLVFLGTAATSVSGWVASTPKTTTTTSRWIASSSSLLSASVQEEETTDTSSSSSLLLPEFQTALDGALTKLKASIPEAYHDTMLPLLQHFCAEYVAANQAAYLDTQSETCAPLPTVQRILQAIQYGMQYGTGPHKYLFTESHQALRKGDYAANPEADFYDFGCDFFRPCMNQAHSQVLGQEHLQQAMEQLQAGENVVFLANHQSEADPQVVSCCLEWIGLEQAAADMVYVAGHKVTTDPLAIPFSMGRNLICIHSKKHLHADPEKKAEKQSQNLRAMNCLLEQFKQPTGALVWVAPSGGRDRRNVETGQVPLAPFDAKTVDMFRLLGRKSKVPTHFYTLGMVSYNLCPPPDFVEAGVGEQRNVRYVPVGIACGPEVVADPDEARADYTARAFRQCQEDYQALLDAIEAAQTATTTTAAE